MPLISHYIISYRGNVTDPLYHLVVTHLRKMNFLIIISFVYHNYFLHNNYGETQPEVIVVRATCPKLVVKFPLRPALLWSGQARLRNLLFIKPTKRLLFL